MEKTEIKKESSVWAIIGRRGSGKSTMLANIGETDFSIGKKIISNFGLSFDHIELTFAELIEEFSTSDILQDATIVFDEFQVGAGARNALRNTNKDLNQFITQLRKRNIILYYGTQNFKYVDIDVRSQTDYLMYTEAVDREDEDNHKFKIIIVDRNDHSDSAFGTVINSFIWDATDLFERNVFDTNEIINFGKEKDKEDDN